MSVSDSFSALTFDPYFVTAEYIVAGYLVIKKCHENEIEVGIFVFLRDICQTKPPKSISASSIIKKFDHIFSTPPQKVGRTLIYCVILGIRS